MPVTRPMDQANISTPNTHSSLVTRGSRRSTSRTGAHRESNPEMQGISRDERVGRPADAGWRVRLYKAGKYVANRHFRDVAYLGRDAALAAAKRYRDDMAEQHGIRRRVGCGNELSRIRVSAGLSQSRLAAWLHVSTPLIARWEHIGAPDAVFLLTQAFISGKVQAVAERPDPDLIAVRTAAGLTQDDMARKFDRGYNAYGEWERKKRRIPGWVAVYIDALGRGWDETA
uniref:Uncharacterized protein n=2 Tax=Burkholderiaceae TaxID=119060 RepID=V5YP78_9BURK|nr:hypothetical protein [Burkholderia sp. M701]